MFTSLPTLVVAARVLTLDSTIGSAIFRKQKKQTPPSDLNLELVLLFFSVLLLVGDLSLLRAEQLVTECTYEQE